MAYTLSNKCAKISVNETDSSTSTYHQKRGHVFFFGTQCITSEAPTDMKFYYQWRING